MKISRHNIPRALVASTLLIIVAFQLGCKGSSGGDGGDEAPITGSSSYTLHGLNFSPYINEDPNIGATVTTQRIRERLSIVSEDMDWIRSFGSTNGLENIAPIAREFGLKTAIGAWLDSDMITNDQEIASLISTAQSGFVDIAIVGSEVLLRGDLSSDELISYIERVQNALAGLDIPVTTVERFRELLVHQEVVEACNVIMVNYYPFWEGLFIEDAVPVLHDWHLSMKAAAVNKEVIVAETGWPSAGDPVAEAEPSLTNAAQYFLNFVSWARSENVAYFYFEATDEPWKAPYEPAGVGDHWGIRDMDGVLKEGMNAVFNNHTVADNWTPKLIDGPGNPLIEFTFVPPIGSLENLQGRVSHVVSSAYKIAVYIRVNSGWWTKPFFNAPLTSITPTGRWNTDITTGGIDERANTIAAFLVTTGYSPPLMGGGTTLPPELEEVAAASVQVTR